MVFSLLGLPCLEGLAFQVVVQQVRDNHDGSEPVFRAPFLHEVFEAVLAPTKLWQ